MEKDPLLERLDEILEARLMMRVSDLRTALRQLMADVAIEYGDGYPQDGVTRKQWRERVRQRFGVGVEEQAP